MPSAVGPKSPDTREVHASTTLSRQMAIGDTHTDETAERVNLPAYVPRYIHTSRCQHCLYPETTHLRGKCCAVWLASKLTNSVALIGSRYKQKPTHFLVCYNPIHLNWRQIVLEYFLSQSKCSLICLPHP